MLLKTSLLKCLFLLNLSTIQCFNVIMMKNLNENQLVNKLTEIANQGEYDNVAHKNVNSISVRSQRKNLSDSSSEEDEKEDNNDKQDKMEVEKDKSDVNVPISNSTMKQHSTDTEKEDAINPENSSETKDKKPIKRTKKHKKSNHKKKKESEKKKAESEKNKEADEKPNIGRTLKALWNSLRSWFRRDAGSGNKKVMSLIDDQNLIDVMKRIIVIMRASEKTEKRPKNIEMPEEYILRNERSGEDNDPLAPGKLPFNLVNLFTSTDAPKTMWYKPNSFWNYWTYPKEIFTDNCKGEGLVQYGNLCIDSLGH